MVLRFLNFKDRELEVFRRIGKLRDELGFWSYFVFEVIVNFESKY